MPGWLDSVLAWAFFTDVPLTPFGLAGLVCALLSIGAWMERRWG